jgi:putative endonuclease
VSNYTAGHEAEERAAQYLKRHGFKVRELNWKTPRCEIDIIAEKHKAIYFAEVKYRRTASQGSGLDYITNRKLTQMQYAAQTWVAQNNWPGEHQLAVISIDGNDISLISEVL